MIIPGTALVVTGGHGEGGKVLSSTELYGRPAFELPPLPAPRTGHVTFLTTEGDLVTCLGVVDPQQSDVPCLTLPPGGTSWQVSRLDNPRPRIKACVVTTSAGTYLLGGVKTAEDSQLLPAGGTSWIRGPELPFPVSMSDGCAVDLSENSFLLIGGHQQQVAEYGGGGWVQGWGDLEAVVQVLECARLGEHIVVVGETWNGEGVTEVIQTTTKEHKAGKRLLQGRRSFHLVTAHSDGSEQRLLAVGGLAVGDSVDGRGSRNKRVKSVEEWDPDTHEWSALPDLKEKRSDFGAVALPVAMSCTGSPPDIPHGTTSCGGQEIGTKCQVSCTEVSYRLADNTRNSVVCGWNSTWVVEAECGEFIIHRHDLLVFPVRHGGWSTWGDWSACLGYPDRTCHRPSEGESTGGTSTRERTCNNPYPDGGKECDGQPTAVKDCQLRECQIRRNMDHHLIYIIFSSTSFLV